MTKKKVSGKAQGARQDEAEKWLAENDPDYAEQKKKWTAPTTDALARVHSELNKEHRMFKDFDPVPGQEGNYARRGHVYGDSLDEERITISFEADDDDLLEDEYDEDSRP